MRMTIEIDDMLMAEAQKVSGQSTRKPTIEQAFRLMVRLGRQREVGSALANTRGAAILREIARDRRMG